MSFEGIEIWSSLENIAGIKLNRKYNLNAPKGVNGRNSDNALILEKFNWQPSISLETGIEKTYSWIYDQIKNNQKSI
jgi:nucleoside-diphosphate-sugar epimerase